MVVQFESDGALEQGFSDSLPREDQSKISDDAQFSECRTNAATVGIPEFGASTIDSPELESNSLFGGNKNNNLMIKLVDTGGKNLSRTSGMDYGFEMEDDQFLMLILSH